MREAHVLVVDDEPHLAGALCRALGLQLGSACIAESAPSAEAALERLMQTPFDVLVTDLCLPGMDGVALIREAKQARPEVPLRTVLITAYGTPDIETTALDLADVYLPKPFSLGLFVLVVRQVLQEHPCHGAE